LWHNLRVLMALDSKEYDAIQVRDMSVTAFAGLVAARIKGVRFFYWLSYPQSEGQISRAKARGFKGGMRFWFPLVQGVFGKWLLYRIVLPRADHVFVQSRQMQSVVAAQGVAIDHMTPVPMGVDMEMAEEKILPADDHRLAGRRVLVYLGTLDPDRKIEILFQMLAHVRKVSPEAVLLLVGDTTDAAHLAWLKQEAELAGVSNHVIWTGWLESAVAWRYAKAAEIGLSPIPRGYLLDMASPTKAIEYMALGLPVVVNDNPDQAEVIAESGAGYCVPLEPSKFAEAVIRLMGDAESRQRMSAAGRKYVSRVRAYDRIAEHVASAYRASFSRQRP
jgi:glycosyltransferase involved in cell wall biosynthesis